MSNHPRMRWHPTSGESQVFTADSEVPEGWLDHHPDDPRHVAVEKQPDPKAKAPIGAAAAVALPMTRDEIKAALDKAEIVYAKNAKDQTLYDLLLTSLRTYLTAQTVEFSETDDAPALLKLVSPSAE